MSPQHAPRRQSNPVMDAEVASSNSTANAFLGGRRPSWMHSAKPVKPSPRPQGSLAKQQQALAATTLPNAAAGVLPSPAPSDEPSPSVSNPNDSPNSRSASLPDSRAADIPSSTLPPNQPGLDGRRVRARFVADVTGPAALVPPADQSLHSVPDPALAPAPAPVPAQAAVAGIPRRESLQGPNIQSPTLQSPTMLAPPVIGMVATPRRPEEMSTNPEWQGPSLPQAPQPHPQQHPRPAPSQEGNQVVSDRGQSRKRRRVDATTTQTAAFSFKAYVSRIDAHIVRLGGIQLLSFGVERPRFQLLRDACLHEDGFFVMLHQVFCVWSFSPSAVQKIPGFGHPEVAKAFELLGQVLKRNDDISKANIEWFAAFPGPLEKILTSQIAQFSELLASIALFLRRLCDHWTGIVNCVTPRGYPCLMDELAGILGCKSPVLQLIFFTASRRRLGVPDGEAGIDMERLFRQDQSAHLSSEGTVSANQLYDQVELERRNAQLVLSYRQIAQYAARPPAAMPSQPHGAIPSPTVSNPHSPVAMMPPSPAIAQGTARAAPQAIHGDPGRSSHNTGAPVSAVSSYETQHMPVAQPQLAGNDVSSQFGSFPATPVQSPTALPQPPFILANNFPSANPALAPPSSGQQLSSGIQQQLSPGLQQQLSPGLQQQLSPGLQQQLSLGIQQQPSPGFQQQPPPGFQQLSPGLQQPPPIPQLLSPGLQQPPTGPQQQLPMSDDQFRATHRQAAERVHAAYAARAQQSLQAWENRHGHQQAHQRAYHRARQRAQQQMQQQLQQQRDAVPAPQISPHHVQQQQQQQQYMQHQLQQQLSMLANVGQQHHGQQPLQPPDGPAGNVLPLATHHRHTMPGLAGPQSTAQVGQAPAPPGMFIPPQGYTIPRSEWPYDAADKKCLVMGLHQADLRSPKRVLRAGSDAAAKREGEPTERFYQSVKGFALGPTHVPVRWKVYNYEFYVSKSDAALLSSREVPSGSLLPQCDYFNGSLRYRLRLCAADKRHGSNAKPTMSESTWTITDTTWPVGICLMLNDKPLTVRRQRYNGKDLPVELTHLVQPGRNTLRLGHSGPGPRRRDETEYFVGIEVIETMSHSTAVDYVWKHGFVATSETKEKIRARLQGSGRGDDECSFEQKELAVDLADPFSAKIFDVPVRGATCTHIECFDLQTWLNTRPSKVADPCQHQTDCSCNKSPEPSLPEKWKCPICFGDARPSSLRIDGFLLVIRNQLEEEGKLNTKSVLVSADSTWQAVIEADDDDDSDMEGDGAEGPLRKQANQASTISAAEKKGPAREVIEILDDDD